MPISYFLPEWDDLVDPNYDFQRDRSVVSGWNDEVYAHQLYGTVQADGLLISRAVAEKSKAKRAAIAELGAHRYLRVPPELPIFGDCGAFSYLLDSAPKYATDEAVEYYTRLGVTFGVSVDHLIVEATRATWQERYDLTIRNAELFLREHQRRGCRWTPVAAVQGWGPESYAEAAARCVGMGYDYLALGGLTRTPTKAITPILTAVRQVVPSSIRLHVFGVARLGTQADWEQCGVTSVDSASALRRAWLGSTGNYLAPDGEWYAALRIPQAGQSFRAKRITGASPSDVHRLEQRALSAVRDFDAGCAAISDVLELVTTYDRLIGDNRAGLEAQMRRTLEVQPWRQCDCAICRAIGIEIMIFRGNDRNRRRGFHNTREFYRRWHGASQKPVRVRTDEVLLFDAVSGLPTASRWWEHGLRIAVQGRTWADGSHRR